MLKNTHNIEVNGFVADGFERVLEQFAEHLHTREEKGAAFCATKDGEVVVDIWGGHRDVKRQKPWEEDTAALMFSVTKGLAAAVMLQLYEAGKFDYDMPVAEIWPEFAQNGKAEITIRTLMNHRAGLPALEQPLALAEAIDPKNADKIAKAIAAQKPIWKPEEGQAYHATTYGLYVIELFRRLCEQPFSEFFQEHIAKPLEADVWIGTPEKYASRIAEIEAPSGLQRLKGMIPHIIKGGTAEGNVGRSFLKPGGLAKKALLNPKLPGGSPTDYNLPNIRKHAILWAGGIGTAKGIAKIFGAMANGGEYQGTRILKEDTLRTVYPKQGWSDLDGVLGKPVGWSQGFLKEEAGLFSRNAEGFGHAGLGGALGWADPISRVSIGYVTNNLDWRIRSPRCMRLCKAVFNCIP